MLTRFGFLAVLGSCAFSVDLGDDGPPTVAFEFAMSGADEASGQVMVPVVLSRAIDTPVSVSYSLLGGNQATPGVDFELVDGTLTFAPGEVRKEVPVTIKDDGVEGEMAETFEIALSAPVGAKLDETRAIHSLRIADHILPRVTFALGPTSSSEGTPSNLVIVLDKPSEGASTVVVGVAGGMPAAAGANDLTLADGTEVTIPNGATTVTVAIGEQDDPLDEEDIEVAVFTLRGPSPNLVLGASRTLDHQIVDNDDPPLVRFNNATASVQENGLGETVTVSLTAESGRQVRVDFDRDATSTADTGEAFAIGAPGTLTFEPGETSKTIVVGITNDNVDEDDETFVLALSNAVNATFGTATHTLTIRDNDTSTVSFQNNSSNVDEDSPGGVAITVRLSTPSAKTVTVPFSLNNGMTSASEGSDFTIVTASPLVFQPGTTALAIDIDVPENSPGNENDERVVIDLGTPTNAPRGNPSRHTLTIRE